ncbi:MAG TPA: hypothetical protein VF577_01925 [Allosphingosinicella sp.]|jgi:hypothetical protein
MSLVLIAAAAAAQGISAPTIDELAERQRNQVRDAISPCRRAASEGDILVCGQRGTDAEDLSRPRSGAIPFRRWAAPESGPWFEFHRGPISITCCSVNGSRGTGAGVGLRLRF